MGINLSKNFTLKELLRSQVATMHGREVICDPESVEFLNLSLLAKIILQPIRDLILCKLIVLSGLRPKWLNKLVGGAEDSSHIYGLAADIRAEGMTVRELAEKISRSDIPFDQLILEFDRWVHISMPMPGVKPRRQILTAVKVNGKTTYRVGLQ